MKRYSKEPIPEIDQFIASHPVEDKDFGLDIEKEKQDLRSKSQKHIRAKYATNTVAELDLHNCTAIEAEIRIGDFINMALQKHLYCIRIIHGKGIHSEGGIAVLRNLVFKKLTQDYRSVVSHFEPLPEREGGEGGVEVYFD